MWWEGTHSVAGGKRALCGEPLGARRSRRRKEGDHTRTSDSAWLPHGSSIAKKQKSTLHSSRLRIYFGMETGQKRQDAPSSLHHVTNGSILDDARLFPLTDAEATHHATTSMASQQDLSGRDRRCACNITFSLFFRGGKILRPFRRTVKYIHQKRAFCGTFAAVSFAEKVMRTVKGRTNLVILKN